MSTISQWMNEIGIRDCQTYLQSGNLIFSTDLPLNEVKLAITRKFLENDMNVPCFLRSYSELVEIIGQQFWPPDHNDESHQFVTLFEVSIGTIIPSHSPSGDAQLLGSFNNNIYSLCTLGAKGFGNPLTLIERQTKELSTTRNIRVVKAVADLMSQI